MYHSGPIWKASTLGDTRYPRGIVYTYDDFCRYSEAPSRNGEHDQQFTFTQLQEINEVGPARD